MANAVRTMSSAMIVCALLAACGPTGEQPMDGSFDSSADASNTDAATQDRPQDTGVIEDSATVATDATNGQDAALDATAMADAGADGSADSGAESGADSSVDSGVDACSPTDTLDDDGVDSNCDGAEGIVATSIYVAPGGRSGAAGTPSDPVPTMQEAAVIAGAMASRRVVIVAVSASPYATQGLDELLGLGCVVSGGYEPTARWSRPMGAMTPPSGTRFVPNAMTGSNVRVRGGSGGQLRFAQIDARPGSMTQPHSVALSLEGTTGFVLDRVALNAGPGFDGVNGTDGMRGISLTVPGGSPSPSGSGATCNGTTDRPAVPAPAVTCASGMPNRLGGRGGFGPLSGTNLGNGEAGSGGAAGGLFARALPGRVGDPGATGAVGSAGAAGPIAPEFNPLTFLVSPASTNGGFGASGGGGGGGGAADDGYGSIVAGGAGSNGGCGGSPGTAGQAGGYSVALLVASGTAPTMTRVTLTRALGGRGGNGGRGGEGGNEAAPGAGQTCRAGNGNMVTGARGGAGGVGGQGGGGAGGNGGSSYGILAFRVAVSVTGVTFMGEVGASSGGNGGAPNGSSGLPGRTATLGVF